MLPRVLFCVIALIASSSWLNAAESPLPIPSIAEHREFLLNDWKSDRPSLVVFADPYCPYCITALEKRRRWGNYNVFLFWAPVLGDLSIARVHEIFTCKEPVAASLLDTVVARQPLGCGENINMDILSRNSTMVAAYRPRYVPQYWFGGKAVSTAQLNLIDDEYDLEKLVERSPLKVDWSRYRANALNRPTNRRYNLAVVIPDEYRAKVELAQLLAKDNKYNWYLFPDDQSATLRSEFWCDKNPDKCTNTNPPKQAGAEYRLLTGVTSVKKPLLMLEGRILTSKEQAALLPRKVLSGLATLSASADAVPQ